MNKHIILVFNFLKYQPWRCLCFGFEQITIILRFLRIKRQLIQIFRTEARTFIKFYKKVNIIKTSFNAIFISIGLLIISKEALPEWELKNIKFIQICDLLRLFGGKASRQFNNYMFYGKFRNINLIYFLKKSTIYYR